MTQQTIIWRRRALALAIVAGVGLSACSKKDEPATPAATPGATPVVTAPAAAITSDADLRTKAKAAENSQHLFAPAGDNAIEYYLALRERQPKDTLVNNALQDLFPYAMNATERNLKDASTTKDIEQQKAYRAEAARIFALLERVDKNAPSLPRLRDSIQKVAAIDLKQQQDDAKKAQDLLTKQADAVKAAAAAAAAQQQQANLPPPPPPVERPPPQPTQAVVTPPPEPKPAPPPEPAPKPKRTVDSLNVISGPQPAYPREAALSGIAGQVTVSFTVNADGSVSGVNVVSATPRRVFDRAAIDAMKRWKFEAPGAALSGQRTFSFVPGN
ncbi:MAG: TonB family protein [Lysobacteraceae bacterium]